LVLGQEFNRHRLSSLRYYQVSAKQHDPLGVAWSAVGNASYHTPKAAGKIAHRCFGARSLDGYGDGREVLKVSAWSLSHVRDPTTP
jgi:hypothetical protein